MKEPDFKVIIELEYQVVVGKLVENETESTKCLPAVSYTHLTLPTTPYE